MKKISIISVVTLLMSCVNNETQADIATEESGKTARPLSFMEPWSEIELSHTDDKYGEWGGDTDLIVIYFDGKKVYADYSRYLGDKIPPPPPKENEGPKKWYEYQTLESRINNIELNENEKHLAEAAIIELLKNKLSNNLIPVSGPINRVVTKDSSLIIYDYNSTKWELFQELKTELTEK